MDYGGHAFTGTQRTVEGLKKSFFDRDVVIRAMDRVTAKALSRFGAFVRQRWRTSLRYRDGVSAPGTPPHAHKTMTRPKTNRRTGVVKVQSSSPLRDFILFAYEKAMQAVIIGPAKTNQVFFNGDREPVTGTVPRVLEEGGQIRIAEEWTGDGWRRIDLRRRGAKADAHALITSGRTSGRDNVFRGRPIRMRAVTIRARPAGHPAFHAELPKLLTFFHNAI